MKEINPIHRATLSAFQQLPPEAFVRAQVVMCLFSCSRATLWRWVQAGRVPAARKMGARNAVWQVGELRQALAEFAMSQGPLASSSTK